MKLTDIFNKKPEHHGLMWRWQSAYADADDDHYVLYGQLWDLLRGQEGDLGIYKYYKTEYKAKKDLMRATSIYLGKLSKEYLRGDR